MPLQLVTSPRHSSGIHAILLTWPPEMTTLALHSHPFVLADPCPCSHARTPYRLDPSPATASMMPLCPIPAPPFPTAPVPAIVARSVPSGPTLCTPPPSETA